MANTNNNVWKVVTGIGVVVGAFSLMRNNVPGPARTLSIVLLSVSIICCIALLLGVGASKEPDKNEMETDGDPLTPENPPTKQREREW